MVHKGWFDAYPTPLPNLTFKWTSQLVHEPLILLTRPNCDCGDGLVADQEWTTPDALVAKHVLNTNETHCIRPLERVNDTALIYDMVINRPKTAGHKHDQQYDRTRICKTAHRASHPPIS